MRMPKCPGIPERAGVEVIESTIRDNNGAHLTSNRHGVAPVAFRRGQPEFRFLLLGQRPEMVPLSPTERSQNSGHVGSEENVAYFMQIAGNEGAEPSDLVLGF